MSSAAQRKATFDELYAAVCALPEGIAGEILMDGQIETMGRPGHAHTRFSTQLMRRLGDIEDSGIGWVFAWEREVRIGSARLVVPDLAGWRISDGNVDFLDENPILRLPDWICEVLSDSTRNKDRDEKLPLYALAGVAHVWLADAEQRRVEVFVPVDGEPVRVAVVEGDGAVSLPPFELIDLSKLWVPRRS